MLDVAEEAAVVLIGAILVGNGRLYVAGLDVATVPEDTPLSQQPGHSSKPLPGPTNLSFEESH